VKFLALEYYFWKDVMASSGKTTRAIAHRVTCHTLMGRYIAYFCWVEVSVMW
jgi:hypothetical protein